MAQEVKMLDHKCNQITSFFLLIFEVIYEPNVNCACELGSSKYLKLGMDICLEVA